MATPLCALVLLASLAAAMAATVSAPATADHRGMHEIALGVPPAALAVFANIYLDVQLQVCRLMAKLEEYEEKKRKKRKGTY